MADEFKIEGVRLEELEPVSVIDDEAIFLVNTNKVCRIISLSSLRKAFSGNPSSPNKDEVYYNATYIDNKFELVEGGVNEMKTTINNFTDEINQQVQNINNKVEQFTQDINTRVENQIRDALSSVDAKIKDGLDKVDQTITEVNSSMSAIDSKVQDLNRKFTDLSNNIDQTIAEKINEAMSTVDQKIQQKINEAMSTVDQKIQQKINEMSTTIDGTIDSKIKSATDSINASINNKLARYTEKSVKKNATVLASGWKGDSRNPPFNNVLTISGVTPTNNVEILLPGTATLEQVEAWCAAGVVHGTQTTGSITLLGYGDIPEIDIPLEIVIRKDI